MRRRFSLALLTCFLSFVVSAQTTGSAVKENWNDYSAKLERFHKLGRAAYNDEEARQKSDTCPGPKTTYDINACLATEVETTTANYKTYTAALRSVEALEIPGEEDAAPGSTGKPLTADERAKEFDAAESAWHSYYKAQCSAAYDAYRGGSIAPSMDLTCRLQLMRDRMHEPESIYNFTR